MIRYTFDILLVLPVSPFGLRIMYYFCLMFLSILVPPDPMERVTILTDNHPIPRSKTTRTQPVDFLTYDLDVTVIPDSCSISGAVNMTAHPLADVDSLYIYLDVNLSVDAVYVNGFQKSFSHEADRIFISGNPVFTTQDTISITILYHGNPVAAGFGSFICKPRGETPQFWTLSQTDHARTWWPCNDTPSDKALVTVDVSVPYSPEEFFVVSNGILTGIESSEAYTTYSWKELYPIAPYLVSLAGTDYQFDADTILSSSGENIPVEYYVYPENEEIALEDLSATPAMIAAFENRYGAYPFMGEKYAMALVARSGAMEHQTATSYGDVHVRGDHYFDWIVAHELAHQWWGDWVTCDSWEHIWLNEGFASFSEALWAEENGGSEAYTEYMLSQDYLLTSGNEFPGTVLYPDYEFSITVYDKGAWIVHMLRQLVGDSTFFGALREYGSTFAYSTARTPDLISVFESWTGENLQWFFDQWLLREGRPQLFLSWKRTRTFRGDSLDLLIEQVQEDLPYRFPVDILLSGITRDSLISIEVNSDREEYSLFMPFNVSNWSVDPESRVLLSVYEGPGDPTEINPVFTVYAPFPNPSNDAIHFAFDLPESRSIHMDIFDLAGRVIWRSGTLAMNAGSSVITWPGTGPTGAMPSGIYVAKLRTGSLNHTFPVIRLK